MTSTALSNRAASSTRHTIVAALVLGVALCGVAGAKQSDRSKPVEVSARSADATARPNGVSHLKGDVVIIQGTLKATGANGTVHFDAHSDVERVTLTGNAHIQQLDDNGNKMTGDAHKIDYNVPKGIATLTGDAHVKQVGRGKASGDKLVYDTRSSVMSAQSAGDNRVHLTFKPKQQTPAQRAAKPASPASASSAAASATDGN